jgi:glycine/D-amino acid oxidase-like deaminating enzyme
MGERADTVAIRSPWIEQLDPERPVTPLGHDRRTDVAIIGAGIAGVATAFFTLRDTDLDVVLLERARAGRGATGHNAGQLTSYFERPLRDLVSAYGFEPAIDAQRGFDGAHDLLDLMVAEAGVDARIERFTGHMGMFTLNHLEVHLENLELRRRGGLRLPSCVVSEEAVFLADIPDRFVDLYSVVPQSEIAARLGRTEPRYQAVLSDVAGCGNSALVVQEVMGYLVRAYPDRFHFADGTPVRRIELVGDGAVVQAGDHRVEAGRVVLCTNGYRVPEVVDRRVGEGRAVTVDIEGTVGYMTGYLEPVVREPSAASFIRNAVIGGSLPYVYVTRRTWERDGRPATLTCVGGAERPSFDADHDYSESDPIPGAVLQEVATELMPIVAPERTGEANFEYAWHGMMGYTSSQVRLIGPRPGAPALLYNLGCNGVGFLLSVYGGERIGRHLAGRPPAPNIFDPA